MKNGLYKVSFHTQIGEAAGVAVLLDGAIRGGDGAMYYSGTYTIAGDQATVKVTTGRHTSFAGMASVFGRDDLHVTLNGPFDEASGTLKGVADEVPDVVFEATLTMLTP